MGTGLEEYSQQGRPILYLSDETVGWGEGQEKGELCNRRWELAVSSAHRNMN
jgi:hypothetical protein